MQSPQTDPCPRHRATPTTRRLSKIFAAQSKAAATQRVGTDETTEEAAAADLFFQVPDLPAADASGRCFQAKKQLRKFVLILNFGSRLKMKQENLLKNDIFKVPRSRTKSFREKDQKSKSKLTDSLKIQEKKIA